MSQRSGDEDLKEESLIVAAALGVEAVKRGPGNMLDYK